jgi:hypothetical protein
MNHSTRIKYLSAGKPGHTVCLEGNCFVKLSGVYKCGGMKIDVDGICDLGI